MKKRNSLRYHPNENNFNRKFKKKNITKNKNLYTGITKNKSKKSSNFIIPSYSVNSIHKKNQLTKSFSKNSNIKTKEKQDDNLGVKAILKKSFGKNLLLINSKRLKHS